MFRRIMKMTRAQDGGGNREEVLESWSLGTLSERPCGPCAFSERSGPAKALLSSRSDVFTW